MADSGDTPTLEDVIREAILAANAQIETSLPARVISYDPSQQRAVCKPLIRGVRLDSETDARIFYDLPTIPGVPVAFPQASGFSITWPISAGDRGLLVFCDRDISGWLSNDNDSSEPQDARRHDVNDAVFIPGVSSFASPLGAGAIAAGAMVVRGSDVRLGSSTAVDPVALSSLTDAQFAALSTAFSTWVPVAGDGGAALKTLLTTLISGGWPAAVGATKVSAE